MSFSKVIIYGWKMYTHTSSYVNYGYYRAFKELGYETLWIDDSDDVSNINFDNCLFFTEGQTDSKIPLNKSSTYILHNCNQEKYRDYKHLNLQIHHHSIQSENLDPPQHPTFTSKKAIKKINEYTCHSDNILFLPWASDLLPREINLDDVKVDTTNRDAIWIGTYGGGESVYQNHSTLDPFFDECRNNGIGVKIIDPWITPVSPEDNFKIVNESYLAPAIQGEWQIKVGYAPHCRIMKNISYGQMGITNNEYVNKLFGNRLVFDKDTRKLFHKAIEKRTSPNLKNEIQDLMSEVKEKHTYVSRVKQILEIL